MERLGFIGLGRMGQAMAGRLLAAGFPLTVHNRTRSRANALVAAGAAWADTPSEVTARSDIIFTILTDEQAVETVYRGQNGLLSTDASGRLFIEMSTIRTATILALAEAVEQRGAHLLDAPVSGTVAPAREGQLLVLVGGRTSDVERARPALQVLGRRIIHLGGQGAGITMKLALNMTMACFWGALAESLAMGQQFGLSLETMLDVYLDSPVALPALHGKMPTLLGKTSEVAFDVTGVRKDLRSMVATAQDAGVPAPVATAALAHFAAATAAGYGERDLVAVVDYLADVARRTARPAFTLGKP
ncbi:MAG: NAD(P)-dependent oxidoreductase [Roseiflexus sp.]|nr:NAD(P)-dependent oxidoreductase [Roseiflexus sp.]MDW8144948.1 NAD(P)-dependent oxidoreductase [Roseiflexaceae bacterium]MDW8233220.1 NAD(P)-dependent oxidoreductase [Roseiflexaceae bacterium]